ncbi:MAG TPA: substrate-binding domain-containing protein [Bryobacteraceae bacterium]|nr:substrate-binding domain-containing protein [Bryobacteraceae bacterium]
MYFRCLSALLLFALPALCADGRVLRVCADPNNLPFSNEAGGGFENRLAELIASDLKAQVKYTWWSERRSFLKNSLNAGLCDVVLGVPSSLDTVSTTAPYFRSTYVFVSRADHALQVTSLNDAVLDKLRIGIHMVGDDYTPPAHLLAQRGLSSHIVSYRLFGKFGEPNPPAKLIDAVVNGDIDIAIVWGPFAGYFAKQQRTALTIAPVSPAHFFSIPFIYDMSAAVRKGDEALRAEINSALAHQCLAIHSLLVQYGIPLVQEEKPRCESSQPAAAYLH